MYYYQILGVTFSLTQRNKFLKELPSQKNCLHIDFIIVETLPEYSCVTFEPLANGTLVICPQVGSILFEGYHAQVKMTASQDERGALIIISETVLPMFYALQGALVLHASAVSHGGSGACFIGESCSGKSTRAALEFIKGADLLTQDVTVLTYNEDKTDILIQPGGGFLELRKESLSLVGDALGDSERCFDKYIFHVPIAHPAVLRNIHFLNPSTTNSNVETSFQFFQAILKSIITAHYTAKYFPEDLLLFIEIMKRKVAIHQESGFAP